MSQKVTTKHGRTMPYTQSSCFKTTCLIALSRSQCAGNQWCGNSQRYASWISMHEQRRMWQCLSQCSPMSKREGVIQVLPDNWHPDIREMENIDLQQGLLGHRKWARECKCMDALLAFGHRLLCVLASSHCPPPWYVTLVQILTESQQWQPNRGTLLIMTWNQWLNTFSNKRPDDKTCCWSNLW